MTEGKIAELLQPYLVELPVSVPNDLFAQLQVYLELLTLWNGRTNLTAIRSEEDVVRRHFGEGLYAIRAVSAGVRSVLDLGSGAGFPGLPMKLMRPDLSVTLAESQGKKVNFLREVVRELDVQVTVHAGRAEDLVGRQAFDLVAMRAVDNPAKALRTAKLLARQDVLLLTTTAGLVKMGLASGRVWNIPNTLHGRLVLV